MGRNGEEVFLRGDLLANECVFIIAIQCVSIGIQCDGGAVRVDG